MNDNPAKDSLENIDALFDRNTINILNSVSTLSPAISAVLRKGSNSIESDINTILRRSKKLIQNVINELDDAGRTISSVEKSAINSLCINAIIKDWELNNSNEKIDWSLILVNAISIPGISSEDNSYYIYGNKDHFRLTCINAATNILLSVYQSECIKDPIQTFESLYTYVVNTVIQCVDKHISPSDEAYNYIISLLTIRSTDIIDALITRSSPKNESKDNKIDLSLLKEHFKSSIKGLTDTLFGGQS